MTAATLASDAPLTSAAPHTDEVMPEGEIETFVGRLFESALGAMDLLAISLGDQLGYYRALAEQGPATSAELATRTGTHERYTREWLEQQAVAGILNVVAENGTSAVDGQSRRYRLPASRAIVLLQEESLAYLAPIARVIGGIGEMMPALLNAYRTGDGISFAAYGPDVAEIQAAFNRPAFVNLLGTQWLPSIPDVHARLQVNPPARVADIGCGGGWSSIAIARAYPNVRVDGFDLDPASIELARRNAAAAGVEDRVSFFVRDATDPALEGSYDLVAAFEMIHDVSRPVEVLQTMRRLVAPGGAVIVMDERTSDQFTAPGDPIERLFHSTSIFVCLPWGLAEQPSAATGTVMRPETFRRYAHSAGFKDVDILPIEHDFFRFYRLSQ